jgi:glycolate oxidase FAD binding subunit
VDLTPLEVEVARTIAAASSVDPVGAGTHREVGGPPPPSGVPVRAPAGVVAYDPADLTVCVGAGTSCAELDAVLVEAGQECPLDPRDAAATIGGTLAAGLSGIRRLRFGPLRDQVLEVRFVTGDARLVRGGGPTVKNVTGYDLVRLMIGSLGTLGVITRVVLRCRPRPTRTWWGETADSPDGVAPRCARASAILWDGTVSRVLLEGNPDDVEVIAQGAGLAPSEAPGFPSGAHRGRASVPAASLASFTAALTRVEGLRWLAEVSVGTVHLAVDDEATLGVARELSQSAGGWTLREAGAPNLDGFGIALPNPEVISRVAAAFDPDAKLAPGRLPISRPRREREGSV